MGTLTVLGWLLFGRISSWLPSSCGPGSVSQVLGLQVWSAKPCYRSFSRTVSFKSSSCFPPPFLPPPVPPPFLSALCLSLLSFAVKYRHQLYYASLHATSTPSLMTPQLSFWVSVSCSGRPWTYSVVQEDLELGDPPASAPHVAGFQAQTTTSSVPLSLLYKIVVGSLLTITSDVFTLFLPSLIRIHSSVSIE